MAYIKQWAPRRTIRSVRGARLAGRRWTSRSWRRDRARRHARRLRTRLSRPAVQPAPYFTNYHVWETIVAWDRPSSTASRASGSMPATTRRRACSTASGRCRRPSLGRSRPSMRRSWSCRTTTSRGWTGRAPGDVPVHGGVRVLGFDSKRYVGAQIGIHDPSGNQVGEVSHPRNLEYLLVAGPTADRPDDQTTPLRRRALNDHPSGAVAERGRAGAQRALGEAGPLAQDPAGVSGVDDLLDGELCGAVGRAHLVEAGGDLGQKGLTPASPLLGLPARPCRPPRCPPRAAASPSRPTATCSGSCGCRGCGWPPRPRRRPCG